MIHSVNQICKLSLDGHVLDLRAEPGYNSWVQYASSGIESTLLAIELRYRVPVGDACDLADLADSPAHLWVTLNRNCVETGRILEATVTKGYCVAVDHRNGEWSVFHTSNWDTFQERLSTGYEIIQTETARDRKGEQFVVVKRTFRVLGQAPAEKDKQTQLGLVMCSDPSSALITRFTDFKRMGSLMDSIRRNQPRQYQALYPKSSPLPSPDGKSFYRTLLCAFVTYQGVHHFRSFLARRS